MAQPPVDGPLGGAGAGRERGVRDDGTPTVPARAQARVEEATARAQEAVERGRARVEERLEKPRLTFRRLSGLDRSGPPPAQTMAGQPLNVWTIPNAIGLVRLALIPVFLVLALLSDEGTDLWPFVLFMVIAASDYADGIAARLTGQYSRFGVLLDPFVDRLLVIAGIVVCWRFDLLPHWALAIVVLREGLLVVGGRMALQRGVEWKVNWPGRAAVWPTMGGIAAALVGIGWPADASFVLGLVLSWWAAFGYVANARQQLKARSGAGSGAPSASS